MSRFIRAARLSPSVILVLAGILVGATFVAPVAARVTGAAAQPAVTLTRSASCAGLNWYPTDSATGYANDGPLRFSTTLSSGTGVFRCDPGLPNSVVVTKVRFSLRDASIDYQVHGCGLVRSGLTIATATSFQQLATVPETNGLPGIVRLADTSIQFATINNTKFGYWLECAIAGDDPSVGIYGADIIYTISAANG
jgi:hypothetical protein